MWQFFLGIVKRVATLHNRYERYTSLLLYFWKYSCKNIDSKSFLLKLPRK